MKTTHKKKLSRERLLHIVATYLGLEGIMNAGRIHRCATSDHTTGTGCLPWAFLLPTPKSETTTLKSKYGWTRKRICCTKANVLDPVVITMSTSPCTEKSSKAVAVVASEAMSMLAMFTVAWITSGSLLPNALLILPVAQVPTHITNLESKPLSASILLGYT